MRNGGARRAVVAAAALGSLLAAMTTLSACEGARHSAGAGGKGAPTGPAATADPTRDPGPDPTRVPDVGDHWQRRIPTDSHQVVAVYGDGKDSPDSTVVLYIRRGSGHGATWDRIRSWPAHNGKKGWTTDHREGDNRSPVGVFTLSDAGGVLKNPGSRLPYTRSAGFAAPRWWGKAYWHDFDYVIAIDYNRVKGTPPNDPTRPEGEGKGGGIWLHMDHGSGTSACVSLSESAMEYLLRTLDPDRHPVVVMGDRADLKSSH
ncbi:L,D-transpeptidase family protein [Streptomyces sp. AS02]|uniref:L,D-transpeptidase family protein n=1 Tax=Streptomyces sp. AS02 TaxID=2938946 RepID=UPI0020227941|nr:L,D-transpeptidase family protein [Streptomyces sp. AS02]MCL8009720.1 L,D-transpeptidase family protein [Streptomyces sp. AS02]